MLFRSNASSASSSRETSSAGLVGGSLTPLSYLVLRSLTTRNLAAWHSATTVARIWRRGQPPQNISVLVVEDRECCVSRSLDSSSSPASSAWKGSPRFTYHKSISQHTYKSHETSEPNLCLFSVRVLCRASLYFCIQLFSTSHQPIKPNLTCRSCYRHVCVPLCDN